MWVVIIYDHTVYKGSRNYLFLIWRQGLWNAGHRKTSIPMLSSKEQQQNLERKVSSMKQKTNFKGLK